MKSDKNNRIIRYAQPGDRDELYRLWQACFHDTDAFTDYYFDYYFRENQVLMLEDDGQLKAMLHLNPYRLMAAGTPMDSRYIVGVATDAGYRHRGAMTALLEKVFQDVYEEGMPFVYLMPADEAIYRPFQFAYIYDQQVESFYWEEDNTADVVAAASYEEDGMSCCPVVSMEERARLAEGVNQYVQKHYNICTLRDAHYYERLQLENRADGGDLLLMKAGGRTVGYLSYAREEAAEIREAGCLPEWHQRAVQWMQRFFADIKCELLPLTPEGFLRGSYSGDMDVKSFRRPIIMGRIIHLQSWVQLIGSGLQDFTLCMDIKDDWIESNQGTWLWQSVNGQSVLIRSDQQPDIGLTIDGCMQWLTGYHSLDELEMAKKIIIKTDCRDVLDKIQVQGRILINEIV